MRYLIPFIVLFNISLTMGQDAKTLYQECDVLMEGDFICAGSTTNNNNIKVEQGTLYYGGDSYPIKTFEKNGANDPLMFSMTKFNGDKYQRIPLLVCGPKACRDEVKKEFASGLDLTKNSKESFQTIGNRWDKLTSLIHQMSTEIKPEYILSDEAKKKIYEFELERARLQTQYKEETERSKKAVIKAKIIEVDDKIADVASAGLSFADGSAISGKLLKEKNAVLLQTMKDHGISEIYWKTQEKEQSCAMGWMPMDKRYIDTSPEQFYLKRKHRDTQVQVTLEKGTCKVTKQSEGEHTNLYSKVISEKEVCDQVMNYCQAHYGPEYELGTTYKTVLGKSEGIKFKVYETESKTNELYIPYESKKLIKNREQFEGNSDKQKDEFVIALNEGQSLNLNESPCNSITNTHKVTAPAEKVFDVGAVQFDVPVIEAEVGDLRGFCVKNVAVKKENQKIGEQDSDVPKNVTPADKQ